MANDGIRKAGNGRRARPASERFIAPPPPQSRILFRIVLLSEGRHLEASFWWSGCGARVWSSQDRSRAASGHRPSPIRGAAFRWTDGDRRKAGESGPIPRWTIHPSGSESYGPGVRNRRDGAPDGGTLGATSVPRRQICEEKKRRLALHPLASNEGGRRARGPQKAAKDDARPHTT